MRRRLWGLAVTSGGGPAARLVVRWPCEGAWPQARGRVRVACVGRYWRWNGGVCLHAATSEVGAEDVVLAGCGHDKRLELRRVHPCPA